MIRIHKVSPSRLGCSTIKVQARVTMGAWHKYSGRRRRRSPCYLIVCCTCTILSVVRQSAVKEWGGEGWPGTGRPRKVGRTRHFAPAAPAFTRPSSPSRFITCLAGHCNVQWQLRFLVPSLMKAANSVPLNVRFCWRYEAPPPPFKDKPVMAPAHWRSDLCFQQSTDRIVLWPWLRVRVRNACVCVS